MLIVDKNILSFMEFVISNKIMGTTSQQEFCNNAGMLPSAITDIRSGKRGFTTKQIYKLSHHYGANVNYFFGLSNQMFFNEEGNTRFDLIKKNLYNLMAAVDKEIELSKTSKPKTQQK